MMETEMTISIKTRLSSGIYASAGGGQVVTHYEFKRTPGHLVQAAHRLSSHRSQMQRCYGSVGAGRSWLEIDGVEIDDLDIDLINCFEKKEDRDKYTASLLSRPSPKCKTSPPEFEKSHHHGQSYPR
jgi:hypothetical protein